MKARPGIHAGICFSSGTPGSPIGCRKCRTPKEIAAIAIPAHRDSGQNPAGTAKRHFPDNDRRWESAAGGDRSREMQHRHKKEHHGSQQQAGPPRLALGGNAQRCGDQRKADEIYPKHTSLHRSDGDRVARPLLLHGCERGNCGPARVDRTFSRMLTIGNA